MSTVEELGFTALFVVLMVGCAKETPLSIERLSNEGRKSYQTIRLVDGLATNDFSHYASYGSSLKTSLDLVTNKEEKVWLLNDIEQRIKLINYDEMSSVQSGNAYLVVGDAFSVIQDVSCEIFGRAAALEVWFREMSYFAAEIANCEQKRQMAASKGDVNEKDRCQWRIEKCETVMAKTFYRIDFENHLAEIYCREHPEKSEEIVRRVKELIGRYPEWYKPVSD